MRLEVAIPCFNERATVGKVVRDFRRVLPDAEVVVYDNASTDGTAEAARAAGALVRRVNRRGKGWVIQAIFERSEAEALLLVDGDDTYEAEDAPALLKPLIAGKADMVIGSRLEQAADKEFRPFHRAGNIVITALLNRIFGTRFQDLLSGYRAFNRRFLDHVPLITPGFETETELILQSLELGFGVSEVPIRYRNRPHGSTSKLRTVRDGYRILLTIVMLLRDHRPMLVFGGTAVGLFLLGLCLWAKSLAANPAWRASGMTLMLLALGVFVTGLILNTVTVRFREVQSLMRRPRRARRASRSTDEPAPASDQPARSNRSQEHAGV